MSLTRKDLALAVAKEASLSTAEAEQVLEALQDVVTRAIRAGDSVRWAGFLSVEGVDRPARNGRNPRTGEVMEIPARRGVKITPGSLLKAAASADGAGAN